MSVFTAAGCSDPLCPHFHPASPEHVYKQIAAFAIAAEKQNVYVDPLETAWTVCSKSGCVDPIHVHATPLPEGTAVRPLYDVLAVRRYKRARGEHIREVKKNVGARAQAIADAWLAAQKTELEQRLRVEDPLAAPSGDAFKKESKRLNLLAVKQRTEAKKQLVEQALREYDVEHGLTTHECCRAVTIRPLNPAPDRTAVQSPDSAPDCATVQQQQPDPTAAPSWAALFGTNPWASPLVWGLVAGGATVAVLYVAYRAHKE